MVSVAAVVTDAPRWWAIRRAENLKPVTYVCPFCQELLPSMLAHVLVLPEGDARRRRHAHTECAMAEKRAGRLPSREQWLGEQPQRPGRFRRLWQRTRTR
jgi:hypothetical protein